MGGWVPMPVDGWAETAELLTSTGRPWPEQAVIADLRWHVDQGRSIPGRPTLCRRWNWQDWAVRTLLRDEDRWQDPHRQRTAPAGLQPAPADTSRPPARTRANASKLDESSSAHQPASSSHQPASTGALVSPSPSPSPPPSDGQTSAEPTVPDRYAEVASFWGVTVHGRIGRKPSPGPERKSKLGQRLLTAVRKDADLVLDAMRYVAEGKGDKADFLRRYDGLTVETVLRHVDEYAELWRNQPTLTLRGKHAHDPPREEARPPPITEAEVARELALWAEEDAAREREAARRRRVG